MPYSAFFYGGNLSESYISIINDIGKKYDS